MSKRLNELLTPDNRRLFDLLFRHQVYLEGVKTAFANNYVAGLRSLYGEFAGYFNRMQYTTLDQFTRGELANFIRLFQKAQTKFYSIYTEKLVTLLKEFLAADVSVTNAIYEDVTGTLPISVLSGLKEAITPQQYDDLSAVEQQAYIPKGNEYVLTDFVQQQQKAAPVFGAKAAANTDKSNAALFTSIANEPIPANGLLLLPQIDQFSKTAMAAVAAIIMQGYANAWTAQQALEVLRGRLDLLYRDGLYARLSAQNRSMLNTIIQHISSDAQAAIASVFFEKYQWVSVLDDRTTAICRARNGTIYIYGKGPLPPAHYNCRSKAVPQVSDADYPIPRTYYEWIKEQPSPFQDDVLGVTQASRLRSGQLKAKDFTSIGTVKPLTITEFRAKIKFILGE